MGRTTTIDAYCTFTGDAVEHGTIAVTIAGLSLSAADSYTLQACSLVNADVLGATSTVTVAGGTATASLVLESTELTAAMGARREIAAQLYLWNATDNVVEWNGQFRIRWAPEPTGFVATTPGTTAIDAAALAAGIAAHAALTSGVHGITPAAATVLDDTTVGAMRATLGVGAIGLLGTVQRTIRFSFGDAAALSSGMYAVVRALPFGFTPTKWTLTCSAADQKSAASAATVTIGLYVDDYAVGSLPTTSVGGTQPAVSAAIGAQSTPDWTDTTWAKGQSVLAKIEAAPACTALWCDLEIEGTATE